MDRDNLQAELDNLRLRLENGWRRIEQERAAGADSQRVEELENFWLHLLARYEHACDTLSGR